MKKLKYITPITEITKWTSQDIITTSGGQLTVSTDTISTIGDDNVTASVLFSELK